MTLEETITALRSHLEQWYEKRKTQPHDGREVPQPYNGVQPINPRELKTAVEEFMTQHPSCRDHEFDLYYDFVVKDESYRPGCICGDGCDIFSHVTTTGVRVEQMDWDKLGRLGVGE